jgi:hypothetical protein
MEIMEKKNDQSTSQAPIQESLARFATRLKQNKTSRQGDIVLHLSGEGGGTFSLSGATGQITAQEARGMGNGAGPESNPPLLEVSGDARIIREIVEGRKDPLKLFLIGGLRIRGDLRYFSDLAQEMNLIDQPL